MQKSLHKVALLNDTSYHNHFGCRLVISNLRSSLERRGMYLHARNPVGVDWWKNRSFTEKLNDCSIVIINGEGTFHHGATRAENLLKIVEFPFRTRPRIILINTIYEDNPVNWTKSLKKLDLIYARDLWSQNSVQKLGLQAGLAPDLSFLRFKDDLKQDANKSTVAFGDSVKRRDRKLLLQLYEKSSLNKIYLPITSWQKRGEARDDFRSRVRNTHSFFAEKTKAIINNTLPGPLFSHNDYTRRLAQSNLSITGRFHTVCLCVKLLVPFLYLESNSYKIDALMDEVGLDLSRKLAPTMKHLEEKSYEFSEMEQMAISNYKQKGDISFNEMFAKIENLVTR